MVILVMVAVRESKGRMPPSESIGYFLAVSDIHFDPASTSSPVYGADSPLSLVNSSLAAMYATLSDPDLIVITGDLTCHSYSNPGWVEAQLVYPTLASMFANQFSSQNPFVQSPILAIGNNDLYPKYSAPPSPGSDSAWFVNLTNYWNTFNSSQSVYQTFVEGGYYRIDPFPEAETTLTLLVVHTNWWSTSCSATVHISDPASQFEWLLDELESAQEENRTVWIIGHIPPGVDLFSDAPLWQEQFAVKISFTLKVPCLLFSNYPLPLGSTNSHSLRYLFFFILKQNTILKLQMLTLEA